MTGQPIRVQIADDHEIVRTGFRHLLESEGDIQVVAESASGKQACSDYEESRPDLLIMDISLPDISGLEAMRRILLQHPKARILILSMHAGMVAEYAMKLGAQGFVCKRSGARKLLLAMRDIMHGKRYLDDEAGVELPNEQADSNSALTLSKRELEVCMQLAEGRSVTEIAESMFVSEKTVYTHRQHIMDKLGVHSSVELAQVVTRMGIHC